MANFRMKKYSARIRLPNQSLAQVGIEADSDVQAKLLLAQQYGVRKEDISFVFEHPDERRAREAAYFQADQARRDREKRELQERRERETAERRHRELLEATKAQSNQSALDKILPLGLAAVAGRAASPDPTVIIQREAPPPPPKKELSEEQLAYLQREERWQNRLLDFEENLRVVLKQVDYPRHEVEPKAWETYLARWSARLGRETCDEIIAKVKHKLKYEELFYQRLRVESGVYNETQELHKGYRQSADGFTPETLRRIEQEHGMEYAQKVMRLDVELAQMYGKKSGHFAGEFQTHEYAEVEGRLSLVATPQYQKILDDRAAEARWSAEHPFLAWLKRITG